MAAIKAPTLAQDEEESEETGLPARLARRYYLFSYDPEKVAWIPVEEEATYGGCLQAAKDLHEALWAIVVELDNGERLNLTVNNPAGIPDEAFDDGAEDETDEREDEEA